MNYGTDANAEILRVFNAGAAEVNRLRRELHDRTQERDRVVAIALRAKLDIRFVAERIGQWPGERGYANRLHETASTIDAVVATIEKNNGTVRT